MADKYGLLLPTVDKREFLKNISKSLMWHLRVSEWTDKEVEILYNKLAFNENIKSKEAA